MKGPVSFGITEPLALVLPLTSCVTLTRMPSFSETQFPQLLNGDEVK